MWPSQCNTIWGWFPVFPLWWVVYIVNLSQILPLVTDVAEHVCKDAYRKAQEGGRLPLNEGTMCLDWVSKNKGQLLWVSCLFSADAMLTSLLQWEIFEGRPIWLILNNFGSAMRGCLDPNFIFHPLMLYNMRKRCSESDVVDYYFIMCYICLGYRTSVW